MKRVIVLVLLVLLLSSCTNSKISSSSKANIVSTTNNSEITKDDIVKFPIQTYTVYEVYNSNSTDNEFDQAMIKNSIDQRMAEELKTVDTSGTRESQIFYDGYVKKWQEELTFSINNLKKYLTSDDFKNFEIAQTDWEKSLKSNCEFDMTLIGNSKIGLGTQCVPSALIYLISQYQDRVFHIKYMTMLAETYTENSVPESERLWNKFLDPK